MNYAASIQPQNIAERPITEKNAKSMFILPITEIELKNIIYSLKTKCAAGVDKITAVDIKLVEPLLTPILCDIFNNCISECKFPDCLKETVISPIYKSGEKHLCNNYRPISVIPTIGKAFEKLLNERLVQFINSTTKIDRNQFGFQKTHQLTLP